MRLATAAALAGALALTGCASSADDADGPSPDVTTSASPSPTTSASPTVDVPVTAADLVGDWEAPDAQWVVHFKDDGTYVEDFQGVENFRVGTYEISDGTVSLVGGDGYTDKGAVEGEKLVFELGTLTRK